MIDRIKKHRSHVSSKEVKTRGWRNIPRKGSGKRLIGKQQAVRLSLVFRKGYKSGIAEWANVTLTDMHTGETTSCPQVKTSTTVHNQYNRMKMCSVVLHRFAQGIKLLEDHPTKKYGFGFTADVSRELYELLRLMVGVKVEIDDSMIEAIRWGGVKSLEDAKQVFQDYAARRAMEDHNI